MGLSLDGREAVPWLAVPAFSAKSVLCSGVREAFARPTALQAPPSWNTKQAEPLHVALQGALTGVPVTAEEPLSLREQSILQLFPRPANTRAN